MKKRGISAVVATILIILIVVVGVGIVWKVVLPLFAELEFLSYSDVRLNIVFQGHTVYDPNQNFAFVQIERGKDEVNMTGIEIGFNFDGTTKTYQSKKVPTPNGKYTYKFNFTNDSEFGIPEDVAPDKVTVAPIFTINNKVRLGKILDEKPMPSGRIHLSAEAWKKANEEAAIPIVVTTGSGGGDEPGEPVVPEESEEPIGPVIICNAQNNSAWDNGTLIDECEYGCVSGVCNEPSCVDLGKVDYNGGCATPQTSCGSLTNDGETYVLQNNVSNPTNCFTISGDNIVFDGNGYFITYGEFKKSYPGYYSGVKIIGDNNIVRNVDARKIWLDNRGDYKYGIYITGSHNLVEDSYGSGKEGIVDYGSYSEIARSSGSGYYGIQTQGNHAYVHDISQSKILSSGSYNTFKNMNLTVELRIILTSNNYYENIRTNYVMHGSGDNNTFKNINSIDGDLDWDFMPLNPLGGTKWYYNIFIIDSNLGTGTIRLYPHPVVNVTLINTTYGSQIVQYNPLSNYKFLFEEKWHDNVIVKNTAGNPLSGIPVWSYQGTVSAENLVQNMTTNSNGGADLWLQGYRKEWDGSSFVTTTIPEHITFASSIDYSGGVTMNQNREQEFVIV